MLALQYYNHLFCPQYNHTYILFPEIYQVGRLKPTILLTQSGYTCLNSHHNFILHKTCQKITHTHTYLHTPKNRWVIFISGLAYITLPTNSSSAAYVPGGEFGVIFAADTADVSAAGHRTQYPGVTETVALQMPVDEIPTHEVIHAGACVDDDFVGLRGLASATSA